MWPPATVGTTNAATKATTTARRTTPPYLDRSFAMGTVAVEGVSRDNLSLLAGGESAGDGLSALGPPALGLGHHVELGRVEAVPQAVGQQRPRGSGGADDGPERGLVSASPAQAEHLA